MSSKLPIRNYKHLTISLYSLRLRWGRKIKKIKKEEEVEKEEKKETLQRL